MTPLGFDASEQPACPIVSLPPSMWPRSVRCALQQLTATLRMSVAHGLVGSLARRGSMGSVSIDGSIASSAAVGTAPRTPAAGSPRGSVHWDAGDVKTPEGAEIGTRFPQRGGATGPRGWKSLDNEHGGAQVEVSTRVLEQGVTTTSDGDRHIVQQQARDLDERLEQLRKREAELAALVAEEREIAAREEKKREQLAEQDIATKRQELMQAHNRRSAHFLPNGMFGMSHWTRIPWLIISSTKSMAWHRCGRRGSRPAFLLRPTRGSAAVAWCCSRS